MSLILAVLLLCGCASEKGCCAECGCSDCVGETETTETTEAYREDTTAPVIQETQTEETEPAMPETTAGYTICAVNVRKAPSVDGERYTVFDPHTDVEILGYQDGWCRILLEGEEYYISSLYIREKITQDNGYLIVIDPGHQRYGNSAQEPIGPGASTTKNKVTGGTVGRTTGLAEYELNLMVAMKLQVELENRGYTVIMTRTSHDVDISNAERAAIANEVGADAFIRIHANGSDNRSVHGAMTICQTPSNPYNGELYEVSKLLSECILDAFVAATDCRKQYVWETDTMSGINWCQVPTTILEMGYMTNPEEDTLLASEAYQYRMVQGIANGLDQFLNSDTE